MRLVFMGSPGFGVPTLRGLMAAGHEIVCVYSQPPKPKGRGKALQRTPVHLFAQEAGIEVRTPDSLKGEAEQAAFVALGCDAAIVVAYGLILPKAVLAAPRWGCFNLHGSLLPRWRGAAPIQRAIEAGDSVTGIQVMAMEAGLDTGGIYASATCPIGPSDTSGSLHEKLSHLGADLMVATLPRIASGEAQPVPQSPEGITYAAKIERGETRIDWHQPADLIDRKVRAFSPTPAAWCLLPDGARAKVLMTECVDLGQGAQPPGTLLDGGMAIACGEGAVRIVTLAREGKGVMQSADFMRGAGFATGAVFG
ncbi:MAG: hypothetical protein RLZZ157_1008 [Pseudomonadota bacterium]